MRASIGRGRAADRVERAGCANVSGELHLNRLYVELGQSRNAPASCGRMNRTTKPTRPGCTRTAFLAHRYPCHVRTGHRSRDSRAALDRHEDLLRMPDPLRRSAEHERLSGVYRPPRRAARAEPARRRTRRSSGAGARVPYQRVVGVREEELLLSPTSRRVTRSRNTITRSPAAAVVEIRGRRWRASRRHHPRAHGGGRRQVTARGRSGCGTAARTSTTTAAACRSSRSSASRTSGLQRMRRRSSRRCADRWSGSASTTATWKRGASAATRTCRCGRVGSSALGTKAEVKNLNSFRYLQKALEHEIARQIEVLDPAGASCRKRGCGIRRRATVAMRSKEEAHDYRYFPEPDLPPLVCRRGRVDAVAATPARAAARAARSGSSPSTGSPGTMRGS